MYIKLSDDKIIKIEETENSLESDIQDAIDFELPQEIEDREYVLEQIAKRVIIRLKFLEKNKGEN